MDGVDGGSPTYDYNSSGYNTRLQQPVAQRRVNSEGELLAYHRGDDNGINYTMPGIKQKLIFCWFCYVSLIFLN